MIEKNKFKLKKNYNNDNQLLKKISQKNNIQFSKLAKDSFKVIEQKCFILTDTKIKIQFRSQSPKGVSPDLGKKIAERALVKNRLI